MRLINGKKNKLNSEIIFIFHPNPNPNAHLIPTQTHKKGLSFTPTVLKKNKLNCEIIFHFHPNNPYPNAQEGFIFYSNCVKNLLLFGTLKVERRTLLKSNIIL